MGDPGKLAAASDDVPNWLQPWVADECAGATVAELLGILLECARDPSHYEWNALAERGVVHPAELISCNRGKLHARREGDDWMLEHEDGRTPVRLHLDSDGVVTLLADA